MSKPTNPYSRLKAEFQAYCNKVENRRRRKMWHYPKPQLNNGWSLSSLNERVAAAEQLGYEVHLTSDQEGLQVIYVEKTPPRPWII